MKKQRKIAALLILAVSLLLLQGCAGGQQEKDAETVKEAAGQEDAGKETESGTEGTAKTYGEEAYLTGVTASDYVTLGEYTGIEVSVEDEVEDYIQSDLAAHPKKTLVTDRPVQTGDVVNIDYEGKKDGVAFEGGTAQGYDLEIGSGSFIDGFEDGLIGVETGETVDLNLTFPEGYQSEELAGQDVVFTVTVNSISVSEEASLTDEFVQGLDLDCKTVEEYQDYVYDLMVQSSAPGKILQKAMENATMKEPPEAMVDRYYDRLEENMSYYASLYGYDLDTFLQLNGATKDSLRQSAQQAAREILLMKAIADEEGISVTDEALEEEIASGAAENNMEEEEFRSSLDLEAFREYVLSERVMDFALENNLVQGRQAE